MADVTLSIEGTLIAVVYSDYKFTDEDGKTREGTSIRVWLDRGPSSPPAEIAVPEARAGLARELEKLGAGVPVICECEPVARGNRVTFRLAAFSEGV